MSLVPSLLQAVIGLDGEALVIHVGEKPYVVAPSGQVELATRALTFEAVTGILEQMLPAESRQALEEFGAIQYELPLLPQFRSEHFTVVSARGGAAAQQGGRGPEDAEGNAVPNCAGSDAAAADRCPRAGVCRRTDTDRLSGIPRTGRPSDRCAPATARHAASRAAANCPAARR